jgi:hypothetical protein
MPNPLLDQGRVSFLRARQSSSTKRGLLSAWSRDEKELPLVELEVDWLRFSTLNHRTKAEQFREIAIRGQANLFTDDPLGDDAQEAQYRILRSQEAFDALKADLQERGQRDPAVVTAEGVLINGNRRAAAVRSLFRDDDLFGFRYVKCLVLPDDATSNELVDLETELQIAQDFKRDYSWVNEAMLVEELLEKEMRQFERVAKKMHCSVEKVKRLNEKIQQLHQLVDLSNGAYLHIDFEENETAFEELAKHIKNKAQVEADSVKSVYFLGTLTGVNYRDLRKLRRSDASTIIERELCGEPALQVLMQSVDNHNGRPATADVLDELTSGDQPNNRVMDLLRYLATKTRNQTVALGDGPPVVAERLFETIANVITTVARDVHEETRDTKALEEPIRRATRAIQELTQSLEALPDAREMSGWNEAEFQRRVSELKSLLSKLEQAS